MLDAGCGERPVALRLAATRRWKAAGVDLVARGIERARRKARRSGLEGRVEFPVADYMGLPYADATFDEAYTMETLVHAADYRAALRELHRILKPGGRLALFEYSVAPLAQLTPEQQRLADAIWTASAMHSMPLFTDGSFPGILEASSCIDVSVHDITPRIIPMLSKLYRRMRLPNVIAGMLGLGRARTTMRPVEEVYQRTLRQDAGRHNAVGARKGELSAG